MDNVLYICTNKLSMIGIYKIINLKTKDVYIGSSIQIEERFKRHKRDLSRNSHHSIILQRAWNKYKEESFDFQILEECSIEELREKEESYLIILKPIYNICKEAYSTSGRDYKESTRIKHRRYALENNVIPPESTWRDKMKKVIMLDYNTQEELRVFNSLSEACRFVGKDHTYATTISSVCNNKRKSAFNYKWKWYE